jgi:hypothetical protein
MQKQLGAEIKSAEVLRSFLMDNCDKPEEKGYMKPFSQDELLQMKEELSDVAINISDVKEEKKDAMDEFKARLKPLDIRKKEILKGLKNKAEYVTETCFKFLDEETREVGYYNAEGMLIESRPAYASELQGNLFKLSVAKTGTED